MFFPIMTTLYAKYAAFEIHVLGKGCFIGCVVFDSKKVKSVFNKGPVGRQFYNYLLFLVVFL